MKIKLKLMIGEGKTLILFLMVYIALIMSFLILFIQQFLLVLTITELFQARNIFLMCLPFGFIGIYCVIYIIKARDTEFKTSVRLAPQFKKFLFYIDECSVDLDQAIALFLVLWPLSLLYSNLGFSTGLGFYIFVVVIGIILGSILIVHILDTYKKKRILLEKLKDDLRSSADSTEVQQIHYYLIKSQSIISFPWISIIFAIITTILNNIDSISAFFS